MQAIAALWEIHREAPWPQVLDASQGELMTLDTVISGCVTYYLDSPAGLDQQRIDILEDCLSNLDALLSDLPEDASAYFQRLKTLGGLMLDAHYHT